MLYIVVIYGGYITGPTESNKPIKTLFLIVSVIIFFNIPICAQEIGDESTLFYFSNTLPKNLLLGTKNTFAGWNLLILGAGIGAAIPLSQTDVDQNIQDELENSIGNFADIGDIGGNALTLAGINATLYIFSDVTDNGKLLETSKALIEANIITSVMTGALKISVGRERPDGSGSRFNSSFPSGHVAGSFTIASVFDSMYGYKVGIPLYTFAGFVGLSRISDNKHYLSDVLFGAALGTVVGRGVTKIHKNEGKDDRLTILPFTDGINSGLSITLSW
ncbi:MAG: hypothetical protein DHS20C13_09040 [Thermodesulfobacteriota bacterium]|nr:MAG: hypothetical protein DHS20C13_09040 [Thermodesulfobacteriota bacterium]